MRTRQNAPAVLSVAAALTLALPAWAAFEALDEVNSWRAGRGLPAFARDPVLTQSAAAMADHMAAHRVYGHHARGGPRRPPATAEGVGWGPPSIGWLTCLQGSTAHNRAGAAWAEFPGRGRVMVLQLAAGPGMGHYPLAQASRRIGPVRQAAANLHTAANRQTAANREPHERRRLIRWPRRRVRRNML